MVDVVDCELLHQSEGLFFEGDVFGPLPKDCFLCLSILHNSLLLLVSGLLQARICAQSSIIRYISLLSIVVGGWLQQKGYLIKLGHTWVHQKVLVCNPHCSNVLEVLVFGKLS